MTTTRNKKKKGDARSADKAPRKLPVLPIAFGAVALLLILVVVFSPEEIPVEAGEPAITGEALPFFNQNATDAALGLEIPEVAGQDFDGNPVSITRDGTPKSILFLAHWCPHCQAEVQQLAPYLAANGLPEGVDLISVATSNNPARDNYPPSEWLDDAGWISPTIVDDRDNSVGLAYGLTGYPYFVFADADGKVVVRASGRQEVANLVNLWNSLALGLSAPDLESSDQQSSDG